MDDCPIERLFLQSPSVTLLADRRERRQRLVALVEQEESRSWNPQRLLDELRGGEGA